MPIKLTCVVATRRPFWLPDLNTGIPPVIRSGDWQLSSWSGNFEAYAVKLDIDRWLNDRNGWAVNWDYPFSSLPEYALEVRAKGEYDESLLKQKPWIEVIGRAEEV